MKRLTASELAGFVDSNRILFGRTERPEVMLTPDDRIVKCFYQRKLISTSTFMPQARRFTTNARKLLEKGIPAPIVDEVIYCAQVPVHMIVYKRLDGEDLRHLCGEGDMDCLGPLPAFLADLHDLGVYFRAIHLGNLLRQPDHKFAILDMSDLKTRSRPLGAFQRARNLAHLMNRDEDKGYFASYGAHRFFTEYLAHCRLTASKQWLLEQRFLLALEKDMKQLVAGN